MSALPPSAPIYSLDEDVLLHIFEFNADMFADSRALDTTRFTSQVCRQWRLLTLGTSSLWAKLIDMNSIGNCRTDKWQNELFQRCGAALLWIKAGSPGEKYLREHAEVLFRGLITKEWHRIQKIVVGHLYNVNVTRAVLPFPAPQLQHFEVLYYNKGETKPLFANCVPKLRSLYLDFRAIDHRAPWLFHLHSLILDKTYSLSASLGILAATHSLQELKITDIHDDDTTASLPTVFLSHLQHLEYTGHCMLAVAIFDHVEMPVDCFLSINIHGFNDRTSLKHQKPHLLSIINTFVQQAKCALQSLIFDKALLYYKKDIISWKCETFSPVQRELGISIPLRGDSDANLLDAFLKKLAPLDFTRVIKLKFIALCGRLNLCFALFFSRLSSVETLSVNVEALSHLTRLQKKYISNSAKQTRIIFPILKVIDITTPDLSDDLFHENVFFIRQTTVELLLLRLREGHPIATLDMTHYLPFDSPLVLHPLAAVKGLKVLYKLRTVIREYNYSLGKSEDIYRCNVAYVPKL